MAQHHLDSFDGEVSLRLFQELDHAVCEANRTAINGKMAPLSKDKVLRVAAAVSKLRSRYLAKVIKLGSTGTSRVARGV